MRHESLMGLREKWSLARFNASIWATVMKAFCNYPLGYVLWNGPLFVEVVGGFGAFYWAIFFCMLYSIISSK